MLDIPQHRKSARLHLCVRLFTKLQAASLSLSAHWYIYSRPQTLKWDLFRKSVSQLISHVITLGSRDLVQIRWGPDVNRCSNLTIFKNIRLSSTKFKQMFTKIKTKGLWIWSKFMFVNQRNVILRSVYFRCWKFGSLASLLNTVMTVHFVTVKRFTNERIISGLFVFPIISPQQ